MKLDAWVDACAAEWEWSRTAVIEHLAEASGVSAHTLGNVARGARMNRYDLAKAVSIATRGAVTVEELCE